METKRPDKLYFFCVEVGGAIGSGVEKAGDVLGSGITKATDITSGLVGSLGEETSSSKPKKSLDDLLDKAKTQENDAEWIP